VLEIVRRLRASGFCAGFVAVVSGTGLLSPLSGTGTASAQTIGTAAWCVDLGSLGGYFDCNYHTYEQCAAAARGVTNICTVNSFYVPRLRDGRPIKRRVPRR
jgi:hypothetical protein